MRYKVRKAIYFVPVEDKGLLLISAKISHVYLPNENKNSTMFHMEREQHDDKN
jgi:hypothetical protein